MNDANSDDDNLSVSCTRKKCFAKNSDERKISVFPYERKMACGSYASAIVTLSRVLNTTS